MHASLRPSTRLRLLISLCLAAAVIIVACPAASALDGGILNASYEASSPALPDTFVCDGWTILSQPIGGNIVRLTGDDATTAPIFATLGTSVGPVAGDWLLRFGQPMPVTDKKPPLQAAGTTSIAQTFVSDGSDIGVAYRFFTWEHSDSDQFTIDLRRGDGTSAGTVVGSPGGALPFTVELVCPAKNVRHFDSGWAVAQVTDLQDTMGEQLTVTLTLQTDDRRYSWLYVDLGDIVAPTVTITSPADGSTTSDRSPVLTYTAADDESGSGLSPEPPQVTLDGAPLAVVSGQALPELTLGVHVLTVTVSDAVGNEGTATSVFSVQGVNTLLVSTALSRLANGSSGMSSVSADGRFVAFDSYASNLVQGDTNGCGDVFVRDLLTGTTERVSVASDGSQAEGPEDACSSSEPSISADGRYVAFSSWAPNLAEGDEIGSLDVFVHDRLTGLTERISVTFDGSEPIGRYGGEYPAVSHQAAISADGRHVAFASDASNIVSGDTNDTFDVFVRDLETGVTERVSVSSGGVQANDECQQPAVSADGRCVTFCGPATNLVLPDAPYTWDVFVRDRAADTTVRVNIDPQGALTDADEISAISADGRYVAFCAEGRILVRDRQEGVSEYIDVAGDGGDPDAVSLTAVSVSADGRYVAFGSRAANLVGEDTNGSDDIFVRDRLEGVTERVSVAADGGESDGWSSWPSISADGRCVAFCSGDSTLVSGDTNGLMDVFVRLRW